MNCPRSSEDMSCAFFINHYTTDFYGGNKMKLKNAFCAVALAAAPMFVLAAQVDVNKASKDELLKGLEGITEQQADAIIKYRDKNGPFIKLNELTFVEGVDRELIMPNYDKLSIGNVTAADKKNM